MSFQFAIFVNGRGLPQPPLLLIRMLCAPFLRHLNTHTMNMTPDLRGLFLAFTVGCLPWALSPFTVNPFEDDCTNELIMTSKARLFVDDVAVSATLTSDDPREKKCLVCYVKCVTLTLCYDKNNTKLLCFKAALRSFLETKRCALP